MKHLYLILIGLTFFTTCTDTTELNIIPKKSANSISLGYGVYLQKTLGLVRAKSYMGLQAKNDNASIKFLIDEEYETLVNFYSPKQINFRDGTLKKHRPVTYGDIAKGFYVEYFENTYKRYRMILVIKKNGHTYHLKCFHPESSKKELNEEFRNVLQTVFIDEYEETEKPFSKIHLKDLKSLYYTRDNKFPTEEADSLYLKITELEKISIKTPDLKNKLNETILKYTDQQIRIKMKPLENGKIAQATIKEDDKKVFILLMVEDNGKGIIIESYGNELLDLQNNISLIKSKFLVQLNN